MNWRQILTLYFITVSDFKFEENLNRSQSTQMLSFKIKMNLGGYMQIRFVLSFIDLSLGYSHTNLITKIFGGQVTMASRLCQLNCLHHSLVYTYKPLDIHN